MKTPLCAIVLNFTPRISKVKLNFHTERNLNRDVLHFIQEKHETTKITLSFYQCNIRLFAAINHLNVIKNHYDNNTSSYRNVAITLCQDFIALPKQTVKVNFA